MTTEFDAAAEAAAVYPNTRPVLNVSNSAIAADWLREEIGQGELSGIFRRDDELVHTPRIGEDGYIPAKELGLKDAGPAQVRLLLSKQLKSLIETKYTCVREVREKGEVIGTTPSLFPDGSVVSAYESARMGAASFHIPELRGVTHTPTIRVDGTVMDEPGYDETTGLLYLPDETVAVPDIPDRPTKAQVKAAVELILKPIKEFPFVTEHDRATWIGLAFTPVLRPLLPPPYQMGVITATNPGSGKSLLTKMLTACHGGSPRGEMPRDKAEFRKTVTAILVGTTAPIVVFDNLKGVVHSAELEALLTMRTWSDRWLGASRDVTAPNDRLWLATGNNAQFGGDLGRRIAEVHLDPPTANWHRRTDFQIKNLETWMHEHRGEYLAALLTIARGWIIAGRPRKDEQGDDFAEWVSGLRGLMKWAGFEGSFGGSGSDAVISTDDQEWHIFLKGLFACFGTATFTTKSIVQSLGSSHEWMPALDPECLPDDLALKFDAVQRSYDKVYTGFSKSLGRWLGNHAGRYAAGWKLVPSGQDGHSQKPLYYVQPPTGAGAPQA
jgi:hypothetical protein